MTKERRQAGSWRYSMAACGQTHLVVVMRGRQVAAREVHSRNWVVRTALRVAPK